MKLLLTASALTLVMGLSSISHAQTYLGTSANGYSLTVDLKWSFDAKAVVREGFESFYQGDFQAGHNKSLEGLSEADLFTGVGSAEVPTVRWVTEG